ncbi:MAG: N-6 DNA methylase, partial [Muribaculaceae bacterium]|nr:N-6 DNA methylase [Muribaculaceae bacterium]
SLFRFSNNAIDGIKGIFSNYVTTNDFSSSRKEDAIKFLDIISKEFDVAVANPPYTDSGDFGEELKTFIDDNYKKPYKFHTNLYAAFIRRCWELTSDTGKVGMIHPHTFMFIKSFEDVRKFLIEKTSINVMVDFGLDRVNLFGPGVLLDATFYTFDKGQENVEGIYFDITNGLQEKHKKDTLAVAYVDLCEGRENSRVYRLPQDKLRLIKSWPFIYWISDDFRKKFGEGTLDKYFQSTIGIMTGDNNRFLRYFWEVGSAFDSSRWHFYHKGGEFNKWYGNLWLLINFDERYLSSIPKNERLNSDGISFGRQSTKGASYRIVERDEYFDNGAPCISGKTGTLELLGFLNSKLSTYSLECLNPTVNKQAGDINRLPVPHDLIKGDSELSKLVTQNIDIKKHLCRFSLIEPLFEQSPIQPGDMRAKECVATYYNYENGLLTQVLLNEAIINRDVFDIYELSDTDRKMVLDKEGIPVGDLPVSEVARQNYLQFLQLNKDLFPASDELIVHINTLPLSDGRPHLEFDRLYQKNYDWEEFCIQNNVNPIEAWYQFSISQVLPAQRTQVLAFELITDVIRTLLEKDDDGVMPLVNRTGEGLVTDRIQQEMIERGYTGTQFSQVVQLLGMPLDRYLRDKFFQQLSDHLNLFMYLPKPPFIWHLT